MWIIVVIVIAVVALAIFVRGKASACPQCGKMFAMREISRQFLNETYTTMDVEQDIKNRDGEKTGSYVQTVPAAITTYECIDQCQYCGYQRSVDREETRRI